MDRSTGFELFREYFSDSMAHFSYHPVSSLTEGLVKGLVTGGLQFGVSGIMHLPEFNGKNRDGKGLVYTNYLLSQMGITLAAVQGAGFESLSVFLTLKFIGNVGMNLTIDSLNGAHQLARRIRNFRPSATTLAV